MTRLSGRHVGLALLALILLAALLAPVLAPADPTSQDLGSRFLPPVWFENGVGAHLLGTDHLGRDVLSRALFGARTSLFVGLSAATLAAVFGIAAGIAAGFLKGWTDRIVSQIVDLQIAFPLLLLAVVVVGILGSSLAVIIGVLSLWGWATIARVSRAETMSVREQEYVAASRIIGSSPFRLMWRHILPNVLTSAVVLWTVAIGQMIVIEGALSFIGLGINPPTPSWGNMINEGRQVLNVAWWVAVVPGVLLVVTVLAFNLVGDNLRDWLDPRSTT